MTESDATDEWDDAADTNPSLPFSDAEPISGDAPDIESPSLTAALAAGGDRKLAGASEVYVKGFGCLYAPTCTIELIPTEDGVALHVSSMGQPNANASLTLDHATWSGWFELLGRELIRPARAEGDGGPTPGHPGDIRVRLELSGGTFELEELAGRTDRPRRFTQTLVSLLHMNGIVVDANLVTT